MTIKEVTRENLKELTSLLKKNNLSTDDIMDHPTADQIFYLIYMDGLPAGAVGMERYQNCGLLRSLVVDEKWQHKGFGGMLVSYILEVAEQKNIKEVFLLTTTADKFFEQLHFKKIKRASVPKIIKDSSQYSKICPESAVIMKLAI